MVEGDRFELSNPEGTDLQSAAFGHFAILPKKIMVGKTGFEPATPWSQTKCSTKLSHFPIMVARVGLEPTRTSLPEGF